MILKNSFFYFLQKILILFFLGISFFGRAQKVISGKILEPKLQKNNKIEVYLNNSKTPALVTNDSQFRIESDSVIYTATFIKKNYKPEIVNFDNNSRENLVIKLIPERVEEIEKIVLKQNRRKYKNKKENPAYAIMQEVWKRRKTNGLANYKDYQFSEYEKIEIAMNNIDSAFMKKKIFKNMEFVFDYADSANIEKKLSLPVFFNETVFKTYGKNKPEKKENKTIVANKFSGFNNNERITSAAKNLYKEINLYDNTLNFFNIGFPSPAATDGFSIYDYEITDTLSVNGTRCFEIKYFPKRKEELAFQGNLYISEGSYNIVKATLKSMNKINVNFVNGIYLEVEYDTPNDSIFLQKKTYTELEMSVFSKKKDAKSILFKRTVFFSDYAFNKNFEDYLLKEKLQSYSDEDLEKPDEFWQKQRVEPLSESEKNVYTMVSELHKVPKFNRAVKIVEAITSGYINVGNAIDLGSIFTVFGYNEVEGMRIRLGARTYFSANDMWRIAGYTAYGFKDKKLKYGFEGKYMFNRENRATIGFGSRNDIVQLGAQLTNDDGIMTRSFAASSLLSSGRNASLSAVKQSNLFFSLEPIKNFQVRIDATLQNIKSANPQNFSLDFYKNNVLKSELNDFHTTFSLIVKPKAKFSMYGVDRRELITMSPTFVLKFTHGFEKVFSGDFDYDKIQFLYTQPIIAGNFGTTIIKLEAGKNFSTVPLALQNVIPANQSYGLGRNVFSLLKYYEFVTDAYSTAHAEHHFNGKLISYLPLIKKLKFREVAFFRAAYGTLSDASKNINFRNKLYAAPDQQIYYEYGFGLENIGFGNFRIFRIDFNWRGNYLNKPDVSKFGINAGLRMAF